MITSDTEAKQRTILMTEEAVANEAVRRAVSRITEEAIANAAEAAQAMVTAATVLGALDRSGSAGEVAAAFRQAADGVLAAYRTYKIYASKLPRP